MKSKNQEDDLQAICAECSWAIDTDGNEFLALGENEDGELLNPDFEPSFFEDEEEIEELGWLLSDLGILCPECAGVKQEDQKTEHEEGISHGSSWKPEMPKTEENQ